MEDESRQISGVVGSIYSTGFFSNNTKRHASCIRFLYKYRTESATTRRLPFTRLPLKNMGIRVKIANQQKKTSPRNVAAFFVILYVFLFGQKFVSVWKHLTSAESRQADIHSSNSDLLLGGPSINRETPRNHSGRILWVIGGKEANCTWRTNYMCKFWFHIRCAVLRDIPHVRVLNSPEKLSAIVLPGDAVLCVVRWWNHKSAPEILSSARASVPNTVRVGVFHVADETRHARFNRWYSSADFVLRNYFMSSSNNSNANLNALYIPLGGQMNSKCIPNFPGPSKTEHCSCGGYRFRKSSERKYLWSFAGSKWPWRQPLIQRLKELHALSISGRDSAYNDYRGYIYITDKFGGNSDSSNPTVRAGYLEPIQNSAFVFSPCGNVMETHRTFEAIQHGAIPIIEKCATRDGREYPYEEQFPFKEVVVEGGAEEMVEFMTKYNRSEMDELQKRMITWWKAYVDELARNVTRVILEPTPL